MGVLCPDTPVPEVAAPAGAGPAEGWLPRRWERASLAAVPQPNTGQMASPPGRSSFHSVGAEGSKKELFGELNLGFFSCRRQQPLVSAEGVALVLQLRWRKEEEGTEVTPNPCYVFVVSFVLTLELGSS